MRGGVDGLEPGRSLAAGLPPAFFGNDFTAGLVGAFDDVLAPVFATLDDGDAYLDPRYAPEDFLRWLAGWLGARPDERWPVERVRAAVADAREALLWRGTLRGVAAAVRACTGLQPELSDGGGVSVSGRPQGALPGDRRPQLVVRLTDPDRTVDRDAVDRAVAEIKPVHVPHVVLIERR